jgi:hypothetical protein
VADDRLKREADAQEEVERARKYPGTPLPESTLITARGRERFPEEQAAIDVIEREADRQRRIKEGQEAQRAAYARQRKTGLPQEIPAIPFQTLEQIQDSLPAALQGIQRGVNSAGQAAGIFRRFQASINESAVAELANLPVEDIIGVSTREDLVRRAKELGASIPKDSSKEEAAQAIKGAAQEQLNRASQQLREAIAGFLAPGDVLAFDVSRGYDEIATELGRSSRSRLSAARASACRQRRSCSRRR